MGANEKRAATYHGAEYTPSTDVVLAAYMECEKRHVRTPDEKAISAFDRWLDLVRAEAKAEALNEVANAFQYKAWSELIQGSLQDRLRVAQPITAWLRARANQYKEEPANGR